MIQTVRMALKSIAANKLRAFLTMLGIIIGVMALVVLVSLVNGATGSVTDAVSDLGADLLTVSISDDKGSPIRQYVIDEWAQTEGIGEIAPAAQETATVKYGSESGSATVYGTTAPYIEIEELKLLLGRFIKTADVDNHNYICVINETTAEDLLGYLDCVGEEISVNGSKFTVAGVLDDGDDSLTSIFSSGSMVLYVPYSTLIRISSQTGSNITEFTLSAESEGDVDTAEEAITALLMERFEDDEDAFSVFSQNVLEETLGSITSMLSLLLGGIAAISLLVGGIGIMNIMLVTVTERTREIGIRKAIGATRGVILRQFLIEAIALCMIGCAVGIFLSWVVISMASVVAADLSMSFELGTGVVMIAIAFCFAIGVVFGLYPANKAAAMRPIDALHYGG